MFLGVRVHLYMVVWRHVPLKNDLLFSYRPSREKKTVIFEPLKTDGRADGNQKKRLPLRIFQRNVEVIRDELKVRERQHSPRGTS